MTYIKGGLPYNTDCFSYWQGTIQASYAVMRQLLFKFFLSSSEKILSGIPSECQTVWIPKPFVGPDLGPNYLPRLSAHDIGRQTV